MVFMRFGYNKEATFSEYSASLTKGKLIVLTNAFQKKTQKTPRQEIEKALKIKEEYYAEKK